MYISRLASQVHTNVALHPNSVAHAKLTQTMHEQNLQFANGFKIQFHTYVCIIEIYIQYLHTYMILFRLVLDPFTTRITDPLSNTSK